MEKYIVVFGGCGIDLTFKQNNDESYSQTPTCVRPGGKASNQAVAIAKTGINTKIVTIVSDDENGKLIIDNLIANNVDVNNVIQKKNIKSDSCNIYVSQNGDNNIVREKHAINEFNEQMIIQFSNLLKNASIVVFQSKVPKNVYSKLVDFCYKNNIITILTPCPAKGLECTDKNNYNLLQKITYITANLEEAKTISCTTNATDACLKLPNLIVTCSENGVYFNNDGKIEHVNAIPPEQCLDTTGAGDVFCGNFASEIFKGKSKFDACKQGIKASTLKIEHLGAQNGVPTTQEIEQNFAYVDMHIHTNNSDGAFNTATILKMCENEHLKTISITDHDSVQSYYDIKNHNLTFNGNIVNGCELTFNYNGFLRDLLVYNFNVDILNDWLQKRYNKNLLIENQKEILQNMKNLYKKLNIKFDDTLEISTGKKAEAYNLLKTSARSFEENKQIAPEIFDTLYYKKYHTNKNSKFFIDETKLLPTLDECISIAKKAGGICSLAHSGAYGYSEKELIAFINYAISHGVDALELKYNCHDEKTEQIIKNLASQHNLLLTGGSDFHGGKIKTHAKLGKVFNSKNIYAHDIKKFLILTKKF